MDSAKRSGLLTTEFLALVLIGLVIVANGRQDINIEASTLNTFLGACIAYIAQRGYVKGEALKKEKANAPA